MELPRSGVLTCKHCNLSDLGTVLGSIPEDVKPTVTEIDFSSNAIREIPSNVFLNFSNCGELNMAYNDRVRIEQNAFSGLNSLRKLNLTGNRFILTYAFPYFMGPSALKELYLQDSGYITVYPDTFKGLTYLEILRLDGIRDFSINKRDFDLYPDKGPFSSLPNLKELNLNGASLNHIKPGMFQGLHNLVRLDLQENNMYTIPLNTFEGLEKLKVLDLDNNRLEELLTQYQYEIGMPVSSCFTGLKSLQVLSINNNKLVTLGEGIFAGLESLENLRLNNNSIYWVQRRTFSGLNKLNIWN